MEPLYFQSLTENSCRQHHVQEFDKAEIHTRAESKTDNHISNPPPGLQNPGFENNEKSSRHDETHGYNDERVNDQPDEDQNHGLIFFPPG